MFIIIFCSFSGCIKGSNNYKYVAMDNFIKLQEFKSLDLDIDNANVNVYKSNEFKIKYKLYSHLKDYQPLCKVKNNVLIFKHDDTRYTNNNNNNSQSYVNIYIKDKTQLDDCNIKVGVGNFKLYENILLGNNLEINTDVGNIEILNCLLNNAKISTNVGNIKINGDIAGKVELKTSVGNVKANLSQQLNCYNYELSTNIGEIRVENRQLKNDKSFIGAYLKHNIVSDNQIKIFVNTGNIIINKK